VHVIPKRKCTVGMQQFNRFTVTKFRSFFQYFFIYYDPYSSWKFLFIGVLVCKLFLETLLWWLCHSLIITGEPMHTTTKQWNCAPQLYQLLSENKMLCCWLFSTHYTAVVSSSSLFLWVGAYHLELISAPYKHHPGKDETNTATTNFCKAATIMIRTISVTNGTHHMLTTKWTLLQWAKTREGTDKCILCTAVWKKAPLGLKQHRTTKKSSHYPALAIVELCKSEGISWLVS